ncbi:MAG TPA: hypothetical protein VE544_05260, partial [Nitrososphaeraceae archaeon]|nr:hypothetical protein [Nitrososphaeraceae archaeon]
VANWYLPRVRLEYNRCREEKSSLQAELSSWKAELNNIARTYQQFVDRNVALKRREDELRLSISELERKETRLNESLSEFQDNNADNDCLAPEVKQENIISTNDVFIPLPNMVINSHQNENEMHTQVEPSSRALVFDTKDLF